MCVPNVLVSALLLAVDFEQTNVRISVLVGVLEIAVMYVLVLAVVDARLVVKQIVLRTVLALPAHLI